MENDITFGRQYHGEIPDVKSITSPSLKFAMMQLYFAQDLRTEANGMMDKITETQQLQKEANNYLDKFRKNQSDADSGHGTGQGGKYILITQEDIDWCRKHGIKLPAKVDKGDYYFNAEEWDLVNKGIQSYIEKIGSDTQMKMVLIQDMLGQYNAYMQGASSAINQGNETLKYLARGQ